MLPLIDTTESSHFTWHNEQWSIYPQWSDHTKPYVSEAGRMQKNHHTEWFYTDLKGRLSTTHEVHLPTLLNLFNTTPVDLLGHEPATHNNYAQALEKLSENTSKPFKQILKLHNKSIQLQTT